MSSILLPLATLLIDILIIILFFSKKAQINKETKLYAVLVIVNFIECLFNVIGIIYIRQIGEISISSILQKIDMTMMIVWVALIFIYIYNVSEFEGRSRNLKKLIVFLTIFMSFLTLFVPNHPIITENVIDSSGISPIVAYVTIAIYAIGIIICVIYSIIKNKNNIFNKKYYPLYALIVLAIFGLTLRSYYPSIIFEPFMMGYVVLLMYHTIENPDVKMIEQLNIAKESAEKANHAKTDFLSSMSHEIRTPLNAIVGFSSCIEEATTLEEAKENAKDVISASNTLLEIVNGVLDISKIEAGKLEIVNSCYDAHKLFSDVAKLVKPRMDEKALDFQIEIADDLPKTLYGDHANLKKVITNILSNASKYTDKGYVKYKVSCVANQNVCRIVASVEDSGRGIKKENIDKLFTKFQRLEEDRNTTIEGTGLGLAITKKILELMGGKIVVQSVYGSGSKFTIVVDQAISIDELTNKNDVVENKKVKDVDLTNKKILIVDDNKLNLKVATKVINSLYQVTIDTVESGFDCISKIETGNCYDLILMDDMMPKMSGVETLQKLKESNSFHTPVIALTANAIAGMREKYLKDGFDEYLAKPIDKKELVDVFNHIFADSDGEEVTISDETEKVNFGELPKELFEIDESSSTSQEPILEDKIDENTDVINESVGNITVDDLKKNGIDVDHGIELLGDLEMYNDTLTDFIGEIDKRVDSLKQFKEMKDMPNYAIVVHGLKSDAKYLGFMKFAELAYEHELKSKENDVDYVNQNFDSLMDELERVLKIAKEYVKK